jgi:hypothetical protein
MVTWTYVTSSLRSPSGSNYILGNSGLQWFAGTYYFAYNAYPSGSSNFTLVLDTSSDLLTWTNVANPLVVSGADPSLDINPVNGKLELWYMTNTRVVHMQDSPDGTTWTDEGDFLSGTGGEPSVYYTGTTRYLTTDTCTCGYRYTQLAHSINRDTAWVQDGPAIVPQPIYAWQSQMVFDATAIVTDTGDGRGNIPRLIYAGSDNNSSLNSTDSSIGLAYKQ